MITRVTLKHFMNDCGLWHSSASCSFKITPDPVIFYQKTYRSYLLMLFDIASSNFISCIFQNLTWNSSLC